MPIDIYSQVAFYYSKLAAILPACSGVTSALSSATLIWIVVKSKNFNAYRRIMSFMAVCDIIASSFMALSTTMMPNDGVYPFQGPMNGNATSCEAQGFIVLTSLAMVSWSNMYLNMYYLCTIRYRFSEETFRKLDRFFLVFTCCVIAPIPVYSASQDFLNPTPYETFCTIAPYPYDCIENPDVTCIRGESYSGSIKLTFAMYVFAMYVMQFLVLIVSMTLIIQTFYYADKALRHHRRRIENSLNDDANIQVLQADRHITRTVMVQALMYILAYFMVAPLSLVSFFETLDWNIGYGVMKQFVFPLQGFFNTFIFIYHEALEIATARPELSYWACLKCVILKPADIPQVIISGVPRQTPSSFNNKNPSSATSGHVSDVVHQTEEEQLVSSSNIQSSGVSSAMVSDGMQWSGGDSLPSGLSVDKSGLEWSDGESFPSGVSIEKSLAVSSAPCLKDSDVEKNISSVTRQSSEDDNI